MITQKYLKTILKYNKSTGIFIWIINKNKITIGKIAGSEGKYILIMINRKNYSAHRLAWLYVTGKWPKNFIDHKDGKRDNNKWKNLREATNQQNQFNQTNRKKNATGIKGVYKTRNRFRARIVINKKNIDLGTYKTKKEAALIYIKAAKKLHGKFYCK